MEYKKFLIYALLFLTGFIVGKTLKFNITTRGGCPIAQKKLEELRKKIQNSSESSETYL